MRIKPFILLFLLLLATASAFSQAWLNNLPPDKTKAELTFSDYKNAFSQYWAPYNVNKGNYNDNGVQKKAFGWKQFKRWEWFMEPRIYPSGDLTLPLTKNWEFYQSQIDSVDNNPPPTNNQSPDSIPPLPAVPSSAGNWTALGSNSSTGGYAGIGRINCIAFHPSDNNTYWVGAAAGGLWVTTDNASSWTCLTDNNGVLAVSDIVIPSDYATSNTIYIATGDKDGWDNKSIGVLKSTNGGSTWSSTGLTFVVSNWNMVYRLLLDPGNNQTIIAATGSGVYKTTNGGTTWSTQLTSTGFIDMEYKPGNFSTMYGSTADGKIYYTTNGGTSWTQAFSDASAYRVELAVSSNQPTWVYAIMSASDNGLYGIYKSTNSGSSFTQVFSGSTKNLMGWGDGDPAGDAGGQGWYDLSICSSTSDANTVLVGGVNTWKSTDGGASWNLVNHWYGGYSVQAVHADKHMLKYRSNGDLFECNDGGIYFSTNNGTSWTDKTNGLVISQIYRLSNSTTVSNEVITGLQDNGTKLLSASVWDDVKGGDGMECIIDYTNVNVQYGTYVNGQIDLTTDHWASATAIEPSAAGDGAWVTPYIIDPVNNQTLYAGYADVWKTTNRGTSWTKISTMNTSSKLRSMAIAPSNNQVIYVADPSIIWKTTNGGTSWTNITGTLPVGSTNITYITVSNTDPNKLWVTFSGYSSGNKVYASTNAGSTWTNYSTGLPNLPVNCIAYQNNTNDGLYVGTDVGVYFRSNSLSSWQSFFSGLPNVVVDELEIQYSVGKIRAATYGRGLWESDLAVPIADFTGFPTTICVGSSVSFSDQSNGTSRTWSFSGGTPSSSTLQNPTITYNTIGVYNVTLTASNSNGSGNNTVTGYISVVNSLTSSLTIAASSNNICGGTNVTFTATAVNGGSTPTYQWKLNGVNVGTNNATYSNSSLSNNDQVTCVMNSSFSCASPASATSNTITMTVTPIVTASASPASICSGINSQLNATASNALVVRTYNLDVANLVNCIAGCSGSNYYGSSNTGFTWNDIGSGTVTNINIRFQIGTECSSTLTRTLRLNGVVQSPTFTNVAHCYCNGPGDTIQNAFTLNWTPTNYSVGGTNALICNNQTSWLGYMQNVNGHYAVVTVTYSVPVTNFSWSPSTFLTSTTISNPTASNVTSSTTYTATAVDANGCVATATATILVNPLPGAPIIGTITQPTCLLPTGSVILNDLPATGTWTINPGGITGTGTSTTISGLAVGTYTYTVTDAAGCTSVASADVVISQPTNGGAFTFTWTGAQSTSWFDRCNWDRSAIPDIFSDVVVPGNLTNYPFVTGATASCKTLSVYYTDGASVTVDIPNGGYLNTGN